MRRTFFTNCALLAVACLLCSTHSLIAATIECRVVDSGGNPVAGAEVRIWRKVAGANGRVVDQPVEFDGGKVLKTDAEGRLVSPGVLVGGAYARIVAEADGMLAGRSGWIEISKDAQTKAPEITLKRLRIVTGKVLGRGGQPVDGATVFNSGDGHERVETTSKGGGKFRLGGVPEGGVFLFAEKVGYRFTGVQMPADETQATLLMTAVEEPAEPMATLAPLLSPDEEYALARRVLDPWLERLAQADTPPEGVGAFTPLIQINALEAFNRLDWWADFYHLDPQNRGIVRHAVILSLIAHHDGAAWDEVRAKIDSGDNEYHKASELILATHEMGDSHQALRLEWLEAALSCARKVDDSVRRVRTLASAADRLFQLGEDARARQILAEAEEVVSAAV